MSLYQNEIIRAFTMTRHKAENEEEMIKIKKVKKHLKEKHDKINKKIEKLKK